MAERAGGAVCELQRTLTNSSCEGIHVPHHFLHVLLMCTAMLYSVQHHRSSAACAVLQLTQLPKAGVISQCHHQSSMPHQL